MSDEVKRYGMCGFESGIVEMEDGPYVDADDYDALLTENLEQARLLGMGAERELALLAERDALRNDHGSMRNALKNARYRIEQGRVWNGMGWTLTGLSSNGQQKALDEIDAALQGEQP